MSTQITITPKQYDVLSGFYAHCFAVCHDGVKNDFVWYANQLDEAGVPWHVQNTVALIADDRQSMGLYLKTYLKNKIPNIVFTRE